MCLFGLLTRLSFLSKRLFDSIVTTRVIAPFVSGTKLAEQSYDTSVTMAKERKDVNQIDHASQAVQTIFPEILPVQAGNLNSQSSWHQQ